MADYDALRQHVEKDGSDFTAWSKLLACVEEQAATHPERVNATFEAFLSKFPLCFGYWCKYADLQCRLGEATKAGADEAQEKTATIYDRALEAVPLSVELWKAYTAHVKQATVGQSSDALRAAYKKATGRVGHDAAAAGLWDSFMEFEADRGTPASVCDVFTEMLGVDASGRTDELWRRLKHLSKSYQTPELVSEAARAELEIRWDKREKKDANEQLDALDQNRVAGMNELTLQRQMEQLLLECERAKNALVQNRLERQHYEAGVRRWYFHVKPLDEAQLQNWREYLTREETATYEDKEVHVKKVRALFERCLVPCALYAEFWLRYASWCHTTIDATAALAVATRAATVFLPRRPDVLASLASLLESAGRLDDARAAYEAVAAGAIEPEHKAYGAVLVANFERRVGGDVVGAYTTALGNGAAPAPTRAHLARYHCVVRNDVAAARAVLDDALGEEPGHAGLWQARARVEAHRVTDDKAPAVFARVAAVYDQVLGAESKVLNAQRGPLWQQYRAIADDLCDDAAKLLEISRSYAKWRTRADVEARPLGPIPAKRKRAPVKVDGDGSADIASSYGAYASYP
jgi:pre-mRNA-processing factor 39